MRLAHRRKIHPESEEVGNFTGIVYTKTQLQLESPTNHPKVVGHRDWL